MKKKEIRNRLCETLQGKDINMLVQYIDNEKNFKYNPDNYKKIVEYKDEQFSEPFIKLTYNLLKEWGMDKQAAKLSEFQNFRDSILKNKETIQKLKKYRLELEEIDNISTTIDNISTIEEEITKLFKNLILVADGNPKLVTFAKTMHCFLPNLLMPIDRRYTLNFFYNNQNFDNDPNDDTNQIRIYKDIFEEIRKFSIVLKSKEQYITDRWNRNMPKIIDNIIISYMKIKTKALQFNKCINKQNIKGLVKLMTDDHLFIDSANNCVNGKLVNKANWASFFERYPDYRNIFEFVTLKDSTVIMQGYSLCSDAQLDHVKSIWTAQIENEKVKEWRVYLDTEENRTQLGIKFRTS